MQKHRVFSGSLFCGDIALLAWLSYAFCRFSAETLPRAIVLWPTLATLAAISAALGWHEPLLDSKRRFVSRGVVFTALAILGTLLLTEFGPAKLGGAACIWFGVTAASLLFVLRIAWFATLNRFPSCRFEMLRWIALGLLGTFIAWPFHHRGSIGAGDAHWYTTMLGDFIEQIRRGVFPVWVGQSHFAFNGSVAPLRLAPLFQHEGAVLDQLTARSLPPFALCNLVLSVNALALAFAIYFSLRAITPSRPTIAAVLAGFFTISPAVLAPLCTGDQFMTFVALPFLPCAFYGLWRMWSTDDSKSEWLLAISLAAMWCAHSPIAMWMTFCAAPLWLAREARVKNWKRSARRLACLAGVFLALGSFPFVSTLSLDNVNPVKTQGASVLGSIHAAFPANFLPVSKGANALSDYQPGYAILILLLVGLLLWGRGRRSPAANGFLVLALAVPVWMLPVPWLTEFVWTRAPSIVALINNIWPMQRLMVIWSAIAVFLVATVWASGRPAARRPLILLAIGAIPFGFWSVSEAQKFITAIQHTRRFGDHAMESMLPQNLVLTRYAYASFSQFPYYYSHGYMDPNFENRLLGLEDLAPIVTNAEGAARSAPVAEGVFTAINDNGTTYHNLEPRLTLEPGIRYALRLEFLVEPESGYFQIIGDRLFREYILPDSGSGIHYLHLTRAFGSLPQASKIISLWHDAPRPTQPRLIYIAPTRPVTPRFKLARYSLHAFKPEELPIRIHSFVPYRASTYTPEPAWLETPRMWLGRYHATVNGHPADVERSVNNLAKVRLDLGHNDVALEYVPAFVVSAAYWIALASWAGIALLVLGKIGRASLQPHLASTVTGDKVDTGTC